MKWIETIELRSTAQTEVVSQIDVEAMLDQSEADVRPYKILLLENGTIGTDLCYQLLFDTGEIRLHGSETGLRLADQLRKIGLVNHKVWIESSAIEIGFDEILVNS